MAFFESLDAKLRAFISDQHMFFTASAPSEGGRVNLSPKGIDTFRIFDDSTVAYLDLTGSGNETAAHILDNGRLTIMFCAFTGIPKILRLYGKGRVVHQDHPEWAELAEQFPSVPGTRQIIMLDIASVQTSCGFGVPIYEYQSQRETLIDWAEKKGHAEIGAYQQKKNAASIDGLPTGISGSKVNN